MRHVGDGTGSRFEFGFAGLRWRQQQKARFAAFDEHLDTGLVRIKIRRLPLAQAGLQADLGADGNRQVLRIAQAKGDRHRRGAVRHRLSQRVDQDFCEHTGRQHGDSLLATQISEWVQGPHIQGVAPWLEVDTDVFPGEDAVFFQAALLADLAGGHWLIVHNKFKSAA